MKNRLKFSSFAFLTVLLLGATAVAQTGVSQVSDALAAQVDKVFERFNRQDCPGCAVGIAKDGTVVYTRGYGMANLEYSVPITPETIFEAGSVSKQFTAGAIQLLAKEGRLALDDDIRKYLPEVPDFGTKITIRHLLSHTSGLRDQWGLLTAAGRPPGSAVHTLEEILDLVSRQRELNFAPASEYLYSNTGFALLSWIVKRASGRSLAEFSQAEMFRPLGMTHTQWRDDHTRIVKDRATAYMADRQGVYHTNMSFTNVYGNGGLLTTVGDLLIWNENFVNPHIIGREQLEQMHTRSKLSTGETIDYALGLQVTEYKGLREISHGGSTAGYRAFLSRFPDEHLSVALLCNLGNISPAVLTHQVAEVFLAGKLRERPKPERIAVAEAELERKAGLYRDLKSDAVVRVSADKGRLMLGGAGGGTELIPTAPNRFQTAGGSEYEFEMSGNETPVRLKQIPVRGTATTFTAQADASLSAMKLDEYAGSYYSEELDVTYLVGARDGKLTLRHRPEPEVILEPTYSDAFMDGARQIRFTRNAADKVDGLSLYSGRVRHLRFVRRDR